MLYCIILLTVFMGSIVIRSFSKHDSYKTTNLKAVIMESEDTSKADQHKQPEKKSDKTQSQQEQKPDTSVKSPKFKEFNESYDPDADKKKKKLDE